MQCLPAVLGRAWRGPAGSGSGIVWVESHPLAIDRLCQGLENLAGFRAQYFFRFAPLFWLAEKNLADIVRKGRKMAILAALLQEILSGIFRINKIIKVGAGNRG